MLNDMSSMASFGEHKVANRWDIVSHKSCLTAVDDVPADMDGDTGVANMDGVTGVADVAGDAAYVDDTQSTSNDVGETDASTNTAAAATVDVVSDRADVAGTSGTSSAAGDAVANGGYLCPIERSKSNRELLYI